MMLRSKRQGPRHTGKATLARLRRVRMLAMDVDGVLTDAGMYYTESGDELKKFNTRDGMGIKLLQAAGLVTAFITREKTTIVERRGRKGAGPPGHQRGDDKLGGRTHLAPKNWRFLSPAPPIGDELGNLQTRRARVL